MVGPTYTVLPAKSDSDVMFCLHGYQGLKTDRSLVYQSYPHLFFISTADTKYYCLFDFFFYFRFCLCIFESDNVKSDCPVQVFRNIMKYLKI